MSFWFYFRSVLLFLTIAAIKCIRVYADSWGPDQPAHQHSPIGVLQSTHYENTPIQIYWNFYHQNWQFSDKKKSDIFHISAQNIDCGYSLEPPRRGGSNEDPQFMFWTEIRKIMYTPVNPYSTI